MNLEELNKLEHFYRTNPNGISSYLNEVAVLVSAAMNRQTGVFSHDDLFDEIRPRMPSAADLGISPALADSVAQMIIEKTVDYRSRPLPDSDAELEMVNKIVGVMERYGFKTAGEAIEFLHRQQIN